MAESLEFYRAQAAACADEADAAKLENVRERCLRSQRVWMAMADALAAREKRRQDRESRTPVNAVADE